MCSELQNGADRGPPLKKAKEDLKWKETHEEMFSYCGVDWPAKPAVFKDLGGLDGFRGAFSWKCFVALVAFCCAVFAWMYIRT